MKRVSKERNWKNPFGNGKAGSVIIKKFERVIT
ncbi:hypothetical protein C5S35_03160 [Candidatus Methanophagaceae archaeon]|nr:hypothetical protein C5S35_03160 [Methanophagales archaeon]